MKDNATVALDTPEQKVSYGLGWQFGRHLQTHDFQGLDFDVVFEGMKDCFSDKTPPLGDPDVQAAFKIIADKNNARRAEQAKIYGATCAKFLAKNAEKPEVQVTESGLQYEVIKEGTGKSVGPIDSVEAHYHGTLIEGTVFDSSIMRGEPMTFNVQEVIPGWQEALQLMKEGGKLKLYVPGDLAYGELGNPPKIPGDATLIFELELIKVQ